MLKSVLAVIVGYLAMAIFLFAAFTGVYLALGTERTFQPDTYVVSGLWLALAAIVSFCGAIVGGFVCAAISKNKRTCQVLAAIVFILGIAVCIPAMREDPTPRPRTGDVPNLQAMQQAQTPVWMHILSPFIGAIGVLLGARMKLCSTTVP